MPPREWRFRIEDILDCIAKIDRYTEGLPYESFANDDSRIDAVIRNITIIGEAARHVPATVQAQATAVPWSRMQAMRNIVVHGYDDVSLPILWDTIRQDLPPLVPLLQSLLAQL